MSDFHHALTVAFGENRVRRDVPLRTYTTFHVGGPAEWLLETRGSDEIVRALQIAYAAGVRVTLLGGGSNVLIADAGVTINGLVRWTLVHGAAGLETWAGTRILAAGSSATSSIR